MAINLSETIGASLSPEITSQLAAAIGETPEKTGQAAKVAVPAMVVGLSEQASSEAGAARLLDTIRSGGHDGASASDIGSMLSTPDKRSELFAKGSGLLPSFFGRHTEDAVGALASHTGMRGGPMTSLLAFTAPLAMGIIGKHAREENLDARGLSSLLGGQRDPASRQLPSGIGALLGAGGGAAAASRLVGHAGARKEAAQTASADKQGPLAETAPGPMQATTPARRTPARAQGSWLGPALLAAAIAIGGYLLLRHRPLQKPVARNLPSETRGPAATPGAPGTTQSPGTANEPPAAAPGQPGGEGSAAGAASALPAPTAGVEALETFLSATPDEGQLPRRFNIGDLGFEQGADAPSGPADPALNKLADVLKAHPSAAVRVEGFTDSTGDPGTNQVLSQERAEKVKEELVTRGVEPDRIKVQGKGASDPITSNATPGGRERNRRIEVVLEKV